jgi:hypothetical protein
VGLDPRSQFVWVFNNSQRQLTRLCEFLTYTDDPDAAGRDAEQNLPNLQTFAICTHTDETSFSFAFLPSALNDMVISRYSGSILPHLTCLQLVSLFIYAVSWSSSNPLVDMVFSTQLVSGVLEPLHFLTDGEFGLVLRTQIVQYPFSLSQELHGS